MRVCGIGDLLLSRATERIPPASGKLRLAVPGGFGDQARMTVRSWRFNMM
jgi:hypothetical protein